MSASVLEIESLESEAKSNPDLVYKSLCSVDLKTLCKDILGMSDWDSCHDDTERWYNTDGGKKFRLLLLPRGHLKTSIFTIGKTIQDVLNNFNVRILLASAVWNNARSYLQEIKSHLERNIKLAIYGSFVGKIWTSDEIIIKQRMQASKTATIETAGIEKTLTSQHYDIIRADDLVTRENITTRDQIDKVINYFKDLIKLLEPDGTMDIIGTRWHDGDLYGHIIRELTKDDLGDSRFFVYTRKAIEDKKVIFPKKFSEEKLRVIKTQIGSYEYSCTPAETPILMSDWKTKPIEYVEVGDELVGFTIPDGTGKRSSLVKTRVKRTFSKQDHVLILQMKSGRKVYCTKDHKWYTGRSMADHCHKSYSPAKLGTKLMFICPSECKELSVNEIIDWNYLAGLFDGEGSAKVSSCLSLTQSQTANPKVYNSMLSVLDSLRIKHSQFVRGAGKDYRGVNSAAGGTTINIHDSFNVGLNLIRNSKCAKSSQIAELFFKNGKRFIKQEDEVIDVKYDKFRTVYALETETGNYVAWGYASSNSNYDNEPIALESQKFKPPIRYWNGLGRNPLYQITVDPAISEKKDSCDAVVMVCALTESNQICVVEYSALREAEKTPSNLINKIFEYVQRFPNKGQGIQVGIESVGYQQALCRLVEEEMRKRNVFFQVVEIKQHKDKNMRILELTPRWESGNLLLKQGMVELEDQLLRFPVAEKIDILDTLQMQTRLGVLDFVANRADSSKNNKWQNGNYIPKTIFAEEMEKIRVQEAIHG